MHPAKTAGRTVANPSYALTLRQRRGPETQTMTTQTDTIKQGITIDIFSGITRVWYSPETPARVRFTAGLMGIIRAHTDPVHIGRHGFVDETLCYPPGYALEPKPIGGCIVDIDTLSAEDRAALDEWVKFCDEAIETAAYDGDCDEEDIGHEEISEAMMRTWYVSPSEAHNVSRLNAAA